MAKEGATINGVHDNKTTLHPQNRISPQFLRVSSEFDNGVPSREPEG
jgi:hypothetical protein